MLKHLPEPTQSTLLPVFPDLWQSGKLPKKVGCYSHPHPQTRKIPNYRPIALTSCVCKIFERMINERLVWYLWANNILTEYQSGLCKRRSITDQPVRLKDYDPRSLSYGENMLFKSSLTWKRRTAPRRSTANCVICMTLNFVVVSLTSCLTDRSFHGRVGSCLSDTFKQEMGVPQGSILSVTLFILKINGIMKSLPS